MVDAYPQERLGEFACVQGGFPFKGGDFKNSGVPVLKIKNVRMRNVDTSDLQLVDEEVAKGAAHCFCKTGDLLISMTGSGPEAPYSVVGRVARFTGSSDKYLINQRVGRFVITQPDKLDPRYLFFVLTREDYRRSLASIATGSANRVNISVSQIENLKIPISPISAQRAITSVLGALDDKIDLNCRMNETLEALAQSLFKSYFVDATQSALPKGWREARLDELCEIGRGSSPRPIHDFMGGDIPWIEIADSTAAGGPFICETREFVTKEGSDRSVWVHPGDLILSNSATCGVPNFVDLDGCIHDGWQHFKNLKHISKHYLFHVLKDISEHLAHIADGSVQKHLNIALVGSQMILVPDEKKLKAFDDAVVPMFERILRNGRESRTLAALRDALLPKLLSGEVRVGTSKNSKMMAGYEK
jgi:type I restriction enzyme S subunit